MFYLAKDFFLLQKISEVVRVYIATRSYDKQILRCYHTDGFKIYYMYK